METNHFSSPYSSIQESDVRVLARLIGLSRGSQFICSECVQAKQILNEMESRLRTVQTSMGTIHLYRDGTNFVIEENGQNAFSFNVIESPADRFVAVVSYVMASRTDETDDEWRLYGEYVASTMEAISRNKIGIPGCIVMDIPLDSDTERGAEGFTLLNDELADIFRRCKFVDQPDFITHLPNDGIDSDWVTHLIPGSGNTGVGTETPSKGCYVATAVYGSYDCPEVWTLRRFRDFSLARSWYGRAFIKVYYAVSPTLVKWFGQTAWFNKLWRGPLDRLVARLKSEGYDDGPYDD